jgi:type I restriction enzyme, R subunit
LTTGNYNPLALDTPARRALYDNLGCNETLALALDLAVQDSRQDAWRGNPMKVRKVKLAIKEVLHASTVPSPGRLIRESAAPYGEAEISIMADQILELVKNQHEY